MALYLTYRPQTFDELIKQEHITNILKPKVLSSETKHNNILFYGPRGTGKTSTARIFAKAINCTNTKDGNPCNQCESCLLINANKTIDVVEIDAASHTSVDNVREEIIDKAPYPPSQLKKKVYIIDEVHMLSRNAFNALLKIMEEPPSYLVFILATTEINKVPETIISRCQVFTFKKIPTDDLVKHLKNICEKEHITYTDEALTSIGKISDGCARDAVKYLDQVSVLGDITQEHVTSFLGVASDQLVQGFLAALISNNEAEAFTIVDTLHDTGVDISNFVKQCLVFIEEHFSENIDGYVSCAEIIKRIAYGLKSFPLPAVLLKMEIHTSMHPQQATNTTPAQQPTKTQPSAVKTSNNNDERTGGQDDGLVISTEGRDLYQSQATQQPTSDGLREGDDDGATGGLLQQIAKHASVKPTLRSMLTNSCILETKTDEGILYVFNKLHGSILQKPENRITVEQAFKEITGLDHGLQVVVTTKEAYLAQNGL